MKIKVIKKTEQRVSTWSGGTTTQLAIYPEDTNYKDRDFLFRISTASVEVEHSNFTSLPGFSRILMVLEGEIQIVHKGLYSLDMHKFDTDHFEGDWDTESFGKARDFNLMVKKGSTASLSAIQIKADDIVVETLPPKTVLAGFYNVKGNAVLVTDKKEFRMESGDFVLITDPDDRLAISVTSEDQSEMVIAIVQP